MTRVGVNSVSNGHLELSSRRVSTAERDPAHDLLTPPSAGGGNAAFSLAFHVGDDRIVLENVARE